MFGRVLVVGGSVDMVGAPVLAGRTALVAGSGLVQIAVPRAILYPCLSSCLELIGLALDGRSSASLARAAERADAIVVGCGMGTDGASRRRVLDLIAQDKPLVIDADALNILASEKSWPTRFQAPAILTPHLGEMKRLGKHLQVSEVPPDEAGRLDLAGAAARAFGSVILLKGHRTIVTDGQRTYINKTGDSSLSKAGTGDVLSGLIGSLVGQGMPLFDAACLGSWIHGQAGENLGKKLGRRSVLAHQVCDEIGRVMRQLTRNGDA